MDDIFVLKSLEYTKRYAFYILFPGVGYRKTEEKFRELIGNKLAELNVISNAFTDTSIDVLFIVVDKNKITEEVYRELYDCKLEKIIVSDTWKVDEYYKWEQIREEKEAEEVDINELNRQISDLWINRVEKNLELDLFLIKECDANIDFIGNVRRLKAIVEKFENRLRSKKRCKTQMTLLEKQSKLLTLFSDAQR